MVSLRPIRQMTNHRDAARITAENAMIKQIRIQNFRSLVDVTVDLDPLTVLIGRSGTGKSNFVQAIRFLRDSLSARSATANALGGPHRVMHVEHQNEPMAYNIHFSIAGLGESFEYNFIVKPGSGEIVDESL